MYVCMYIPICVLVSVPTDSSISIPLKYDFMYVCMYIPMCVVCNKICTWYVIIYVFVQCTGMSGHCTRNW